MAGLLVSVRDAAEAAASLAAGAALIDVKEPENGSLGRAAPEVIAGVLDVVAARRPVSAALGELADGDAPPPELSGLAFVKWGLAHCGQADGFGDWRRQLRLSRERIEAESPCRVVVTAYADWRRALSPDPAEVVHFALREGWSALLLDTWRKDGSTLLDWVSLKELLGWRSLCRRAGVRLALAGALGPGAIRTLLPVRPDWFAVRGAVCAQGERRGAVEGRLVRELVEMLSPSTSGS
jgi:uncharacterized protein (UPF0264 family)